MILRWESGCANLRWLPLPAPLGSQPAFSRSAISARIFRGMVCHLRSTAQDHAKNRSKRKLEHPPKLEARATLEQTVDERGVGGGFRYDQDQAQGQEQDDDGREPPLLADSQKA